jgi:hypothetical protein
MTSRDTSLQLLFSSASLVDQQHLAGCTIALMYLFVVTYTMP